MNRSYLLVHNMMLRKINNVVVVDEEIFDISDVVSVVSGYASIKHNIHYYDGRKHYVSDGRNQIGLELPYLLGEEIFRRLPELKLCRGQREIDKKHLETLRHGRR